MSEPFGARVHARLRDILSRIVLEPCCSAFHLGNKVCFVIDTEADDSYTFEDNIKELVNSNLGVPYILTLKKIKGGISFARGVLSLIFLRSNFSSDLLNRGENGKVTKILKHCIEGSGNLFRISKKFLECKKCTDSEKKKLGVKYDLSCDANALIFFQKCLQIYQTVFRRSPAFIVRYINPDTEILCAKSTLKFLREIEDLPTSLIVVIPRKFEYRILPIWDDFPCIRLKKIKYKEIESLLKSVCGSKFSEELRFSEGALQLFCQKMRSLFGNEVCASSLIRALSDLVSYKKLHKLDIIDRDIVLNLFSTSPVEVKPPKPRSPSECKSPYFGSEIERLTKECKRLNLDPHFALPFSFRYVLLQIRKGNIKYDSSKDVFICCRYMRINEFKKLSRELNKLGYRYLHGTRTWIFSPHT